jgi:hypothetical protein
LYQIFYLQPTEYSSGGHSMSIVHWWNKFSSVRIHIYEPVYYCQFGEPQRFSWEQKAMPWSLNHHLV